MNLPRDVISRTSRKHPEFELILARWAMVGLLLFETVRFGAQHDATARYVLAGVALTAVFGAANAILTVAVSRAARAQDERRRTALDVTAICVDFALVSSFQFIFAGQAASGYFLLFFLVVVEASWKFRLRGALLTWVAVGALAATSAWWHVTSLGLPVELTATAHRMAALLIVAISLGLLAERLQAEQRTATRLTAESQQAARWQQQLVDMLAHDLRAPMSTAQSTAQLLVDKHTELPPGQVAELSRAIVRQTGRALKLTDDLLSLARARAGDLPLRRRTVDLHELADNAVSALADADAGDGAVELVRSQTPLTVNVDIDRIDQVMSNLLSNAFAHGRPPVRVEIEDADARARLHVIDHGEGLDAVIEKSLFDPFVSGGGDGSVGLGLWVSRTLVEAHDGSLNHHLHDGRTCFVVELPRESAGTDDTVGPAGRMSSPKVPGGHGHRQWQQLESASNEVD